MDYRSRCIAGLLGGVLSLAVSAPAAACTTPVYRYAMYNWATSPYVVLYLHHGDEQDLDSAVNEKLKELSRSQPPANVFLEAVDLSAEDALKGYPEPVKAAIEAQADNTEPTHLIITPWWTKYHAGRLEESEINAMVQSPTRTRVAELIDEGHAAVMLFVPGKDEKENTQAKEVIQQLIDQVDTLFPAFPPDPMELAAPPSASDEQAASEASEEASDPEEQPGLKLAMLELRRDDPKEKWLMRALMSVEPELEDYVDKPMVFAVYGRGRAMPPYIGEGISTELLTELVGFLVGPCSCYAKADNPGMDLLIKWDWEASADKLAANDPSLYPDPMMYQEFLVEDDSAEETPSEDTPVEEPTEESPTEATPAEETPADEIAVEEEAPAEPVQEPAMLARAEIAVLDETPDDSQAESDSSEDAAISPDPGTQQPEEGSVEAPAKPGGPTDSFTSSVVWKLGLVLACGAAVVLVVGFVLTRKHG